MIDAVTEAKNKLEQLKIAFQSDFRIAPLTSFKIGGICPLLVEPHNTESLLQCIHILHSLDIPYKILGGGTNILVSDHPDNFVLIRLEGEFKQFQDSTNGTIRIGAAALTTPVFRQLSQAGYTGAEFLSTIPGRIGGAVIQNAGCYGGELFALVESVEFIKDNNLFIKKPQEIMHGYRTTQFRENKDSVITSITVNLKKGDQDEIDQLLKEKREKRNLSQPKNKKSAGSVFKNPDCKDEAGNPVKSWQLIDKAGLRGREKGGAVISPEHCNFIVNTGNATAADVHYLISLVENAVYDTSHIRLEREIEFFGEIP